MLNWYLETGLVGLAAVVFITVYVALRLRSAVRTGDRTSLAVAAGLAGFMTVCLVDDPMNTTALAVPMMMVLGLAATAPLGRRPTGKRAGPRRSLGPLPAPLSRPSTNVGRGQMAAPDVQEKV